MSRVEILQVADAVAREKNMDKEVIIQAIEQAIARFKASPAALRPALKAKL